MDQSLFDKRGDIIAFLSGDYIYLRDATPVAYLIEDAVCSYEPKHIGWFQHGWLLNLKGEYIAFLKSAVNGPVRPLELREIPVIPELKPKQKKPCDCFIKPDNFSSPKSWSDSDSQDFFSEAI